MDINSLLSPSESPATGSPPAGTPTTQFAAVAAPTSAPTSQSSPRRQHPSPTNSSGPRPHLPSPAGSDFPTRPHRQSSTSGMDTLADLAAMQHHQHTARANAGGLRSTESYEAQLSTANIRPSLQAIARTHSGSRSSLDIRLTDAPAQTPPMRVFTAPSLSDAQRQRVSQLVADLSENAHAYDSHVKLVRLLFRGLVAHVYPTSTAVQQNDAFTYELLGELRQALEAMSSRFSLGEELWDIRLRTLLLTATSSDDCVGLMETFEKAVAECPASTTLWSLYGEWFLSLHARVRPNDPSSQLSQPASMLPRLSDEDILVLGEVFTHAQMKEVWQRAAQETKFRIDDSSLIWDKWLDMHLVGLAKSSTKDEVDNVRTLLLDRLAMPHRTWDNTSQKLSQFISTHANDHYEDIMVAANRQGQVAKNAYGEREPFEIRLERARERDDRDTELATFSEYADWELARSRKKGLFNFDLANALFQRLVLRFPSDVNGWEDFLTFLGDEANPRTRSVSQLSVLNRACNHCPWSGVLWAQYIQAAELENLDFSDVGQIKHKATSTGLLDFGSMEEVLKIYTAYCGFLRRQAFRQESTDEERDVAEMGIRSAIEDTETLGKSKYGDDYQGDPQYRLERIYVKFLMQSRNYNGARDTWKKLIPRHGNSYEFWIRYYSWEMLLWATLNNPETANAATRTPTEATGVLRRAIQRPNLDWPEKVIETYLSHCEDHEKVDELQTAILQCRKAAKLVNRRREKEARQAAELTQTQMQYSAEAESGSVKRKREDESLESIKKVKADGHAGAPDTAPPVDSKPQIKRDRENATVVVSNLPEDASEKHLRHFFHDCGSIKSFHFLRKDSSVTATIEFDSKDDALTAQTRDQKKYGSNVITVSIGTGTTLYVTNFPPTADEAWMRKQFSMYGDIASIRFPSLKYQTHRRFCYVQFVDAAAASAASSALDGHEIDGLALLAKLSDPAHKQARSGATAEGREVYVSNVDWGATEDEVRALFASHGTVERVRLPRKIDGKSKGMAFVTFSNKDEANAALALNDTAFKSRTLSVSISSLNPSKRQTTLRGASPTSAPGAEFGTGGADAATISQRTLALLDLPDTVSAARIQELASRYGKVVKVVLRPEKGGALVEYAAVKDAGSAALGLEGVEVDGARIHVDEKGALKDGKEFKASTGGEPSKEKSHFAKTTALQSSAPVRRPGLGFGGGAGRGGRRGGLGVKARRMSSGGTDGAEGHEESKKANGDTGAGADDGKNDEAGVRSNADFRAMVARGKK